MRILRWGKRIREESNPKELDVTYVMAHTRALGRRTTLVGGGRRGKRSSKGKNKASEEGRLASADNGSGRGSNVILPFALSLKNASRTPSSLRGDARENGGIHRLETQQEKKERRWKAWEQWFEHVLEEENRLHGLQEEVDAAVEEENYPLAAKLKDELESIKARDPVGQVVEDMETALKQEEYEEAARLRDHAHLGLIGWWVGQSGKDDPRGILLKIAPEYGRLVGSAYTGKDLSEIQEAKDSGVTFLEEPSQPVMEIFIKKDSRTRTGFSVQVVGLVPDGEEEEEGDWSQPGMEGVNSGSFSFGVPNGAFSVKVDLPEESMEDADFDLDSLELEHAISSVNILMTQRKPALISQPSRDEFGLHIEGVPEVQPGTMSTHENFEFPTAKEIQRAAKQFSLEEGNATESEKSTSKDAQEWAWVAEQIRKLSEQADNRGENELAEALQDVADKMLTEGVPAHHHLKGFTGFDFSPRLNARTTFRRLSTSYPSTDPLTGLFVGTYGPHGPEVVQIQRGRCPEFGDECIFATKLTGDVNIPAGSLTFKARIDHGLRLDHHGVYPEELGIVARYKGEGRVARSGHADPRWVEGELLVLDGKGGPLTGDAQLGFVWSVPGERKFLILFNRLDLN